MERRTFLRLTGAGLVAVAAGTSLTACGLGEPDANGLRLLPGFTSRVIATTGAKVPGTDFVWHTNPDGGAVFPVAGGGWIYVSNSESDPGGASMVRFASTGKILEARTILSGTKVNCAGGAMPWGTWLSCEEHASGLVHECDPRGIAAPQARPAMGAFRHEAAAAHAASGAVYLTEDQSDGGFYRFRPTTWGNLATGVLEVLVESQGTLGWAPVPDPAGTPTPTRAQVPTMKKFNGAEGTVAVGGSVYFSTKGDDRIWCYRPATAQLTVHYDRKAIASPILSGVDNLTARPNGDLFVAEDQGDLQVVRLRPDSSTEAVLQLVGTEDSELTGPAFSPDGKRLYFSSQRHPGRTYEVSGPF